VAAVNNAAAFNINDMHQTLWELPDSMYPGEVLYRTNDPEDTEHYWGERCDLLYPSLP